MISASASVAIDWSVTVLRPSSVPGSASGSKGAAEARAGAACTSTCAGRSGRPDREGPIAVGATEERLVDGADAGPPAGAGGGGGMAARSDAKAASASGATLGRGVRMRTSTSGTLDRVPPSS